MADDKTGADKKEAETASKNADEIKDVDRTAQGPRGNVYSEAEEAPPADDIPPPLPS